MDAFTLDDYVSNIRSTRSRADDTAVKDGREWYPAMYRIMREHAHVTGYTVMQCAGVYSATSANTQWAQNVKLATRALADGGLTGGTLGSTVRKVNAILAGADIDETLSPDAASRKTKCFIRNLAGEYGIATIDRWAFRDATAWADCEFRGASPCARNAKTGALTGRGHGCGKVPKGAEYALIAEAYGIVAAEYGEPVAFTQAINWCVIRGTGE